VAELGNGAFRIDHVDGTHSTAYGVADGTKVWVFLDGQTYVVDRSPTRRSSAGQDAAALAAPMPATVTQLHVKPGQQVHVGEVLITLEAMKMELPIRATADGTVTSIKCRVGELVQPGVQLIELAPSEPGHEPRSEKPEA
jgi:biotin carboxyl carrier protein